jgi:hypothetical protein
MKNLLLLIEVQSREKGNKTQVKNRMASAPEAP